MGVIKDEEIKIWQRIANGLVAFDDEELPADKMRRLVAMNAIDHSIRDMKDASPHFLGVSLINETKRKRGGYIWGLHYREYPGKDGRDPIRAWDKPLREMLASRFNDALVRVAESGRDLWGGEADEREKRYIMRTVHNTVKSHLDNVINLVLSRYSTVGGAAPCSLATTTMGGGTTMRGLRTSVKRGLGRGWTREASEYGYLRHLAVSTLIGVLGYDGKKFREVCLEIVEDAKAGCGDGAGLRHPRNTLSLFLTVSHWVHIVPYLYTESEGESLAVLECLRVSLFKRLRELGFTPSGDKIGELIWERDFVLTPESVGYLVDDVTDEEILDVFRDRLEHHHAGRVAYYKGRESEKVAERFATIEKWWTRSGLWERYEVCSSLSVSLYDRADEITAKRFANMGEYVE